MSQDTKKNQVTSESSTSKDSKYYFGGISEYKLEEIEAEVLNDNVYLDVFAGSDVRFKENIESLNGALDLISGFGVYKYDYKTKDFSDKNFPAGKQIGVMADELGKVLPHLIKKDEQGFGHVNYAGLSPVIISGIQELLAITKKQDEMIKAMDLAIKNLEKKLNC
jgi:hypothetical protein